MVYSRIINESKHLYGADLNNKIKAKVLRKSMTNAEKLIWSTLRRRQLNAKGTPAPLGEGREGGYQVGCHMVGVRIKNNSPHFLPLNSPF